MLDVLRRKRSLSNDYKRPSKKKKQKDDGSRSQTNQDFNNQLQIEDNLSLSSNHPRLTEFHDSLAIPGEGLKSTQHGVSFQLQVLNLLLWRAKINEFPVFRLATELEECEKFDDVVFQYERDEKTYLRLLQAKHKEGLKELKNITIADVITIDAKKEFSLLKYFHSFSKVEARCKLDSIYSPLTKSEIEDVIILTNVGVSKELNEFLVKGDLTKDILLNSNTFQGIANCSSANLYRIDTSNDNTLVVNLKGIFRETSDFIKLAEEISDCTATKKPIKKLGIIKQYHVALTDKVFSVDTMGFLPSFIRNIDLNSEEQEFRKVLLKGIVFRSKITNNQCFPDIKLINENFKLSNSFGIVQLPSEENEKRELANNLADDILKKSIPENKYDCSIALAAEVIDVENKTLRDKSSELKKRIKNSLQEKLSRKITFEDMKKMRFEISSDFGCLQLPENCTELAEKFCELYVNHGELSPDSLGEYHVPIAKYVIDVNRKTWNKSFVKGEFADNIAFFHRLKNFRRQVIDNLIRNDDLKSESLLQFRVTFSEGFIKSVLPTTELPHFEVKTFARQIANQIVKAKSANIKTITIDDSSVPSDELDLFKENFNKLAGLVFIRKYHKIRFISNFLKSDNHQNQIKKLRSELRLHLNNLFDILYEYEFEIKYNTFFTYDEEELLRNLPVRVSEKDYSKFFDKLKFIVNYPNRQQLFHLIQEEMRNYFKEVESDNIIALLQKDLYDWMTKRDSTFHTAGTVKSLFQELRNSLRLREMIGVSEGFISNITTRFKFMNFIDFCQFLKDRKLNVIHFHTDSIPIIFIRIKQTLDYIIQNCENDDAIISYISRGAYIFVSHMQLSDESFMKNVAESFKLQVNLLMIECTEDLIKPLEIQLATKGTSKKIIFVTRINEIDESWNHFGGDGPSTSKYVCKDIKNKFEDLTQKSRESLLSKDIFFQRKLIKLNSLFDGKYDCENIIDGITLEKLLLPDSEEDRLEISNDLGKVGDCYISRGFVRERSYNEDYIVTHEEKVVIISDVPGMGKSTALTSIGLKINILYPCTWLFRINLNDYTEILAQKNEKNDFDDPIAVVRFLLRFELDASTLETEFEKKLFIHNFVHKGNVIFLIDGFDEICPDYKDVTLKMMSTLKQSNIQKMFITTRTMFRKDLEDSLKTKAFIMKPIPRDDQRQFLIKYWNQNCDESENKFQRIEIYADALIKNIHSTIIDGNGEFSGIALQLVMLAEIFENGPPLEMSGNAFKWQGCENFLKSTNDVPNLPTHMNLFHLYEQFMNKKYEIYFTMKKKEDETNIATKNDKAIIVEDFFKWHQILAIYSFFHSNYQHKLTSVYNIINVDQQVDKITLNKEKMGLISYAEHQTISIAQKHSISSLKVTFVHRTFAEFFLGNYFANIFLQNKYNSMYNEIWMFIINELLVEAQYQIIRYFINGKLVDAAKICVTDESPSFFDRLWKQCGFTTVDGGKIFLHTLAAEGCENIILTLWGKFSSTLKSLLSSEGDDSRVRPLHLAARFGHLNLVKWFIEPIENGGGGVDMDSEDNDGHTPLLAASNQIHVVKWLIQKKGKCGGGVNHEKYYKSGDKLIHHYASIGNFELVKWMLEPEHKEGMGIDVNLGDRDGTKLIHYIANSPRFKEILTWIVESPDVGPIDLYARDSDGNTIFHYAAFKGQIEILQWLLSPKAQGGIGGNLNHVTPTNGSTLLHEAAISGNIELIKWLLSHENTINAIARDEDGRTALHEASKYGHLGIVELLLTSTHEFDILLKDKNDLSALHEAASFGDFRLCHYLISKCGSYVDEGYYVAMLHRASQYGELELIQWLINDIGVDVDAVNDDGETALHFACRCVNENVIEWLIKWKAKGGAGANVNKLDKDGRTPLMAIISSDRKSGIYKWLNDKNVDIPVCSIEDNGQYHITFATDTPTHIKNMLERKATIPIEETKRGFLLRVDKLRIIKALIAADVRVDSRDKDGRTILHCIAASDFFCFDYDSLNLIEHLLQHNNIYAEDNNGKTMLHYAVDYFHTNLISWILKDKSEGGGGVDAEFLYKSLNRSIVQYALEKRELPELKQLILRRIACAISPSRRIWAVLVFTIEAFNLDFARWLVKTCSMNFSELDSEGRSLLYHICKYKNLDMLKFLIKPNEENEFQCISGGGLNIKLLDKNGKSILHYAVEFSAVEIIDWWLTENQNFLDKVTEDDDSATNPLFYAIKFGKLDILKVFLKTPSRKFSEYEGKNGKCLIHIAVEESQFDIVKWLGTPKSKGGGGVDVNSDDERQKTPLHYAVELQRFEILQWLILPRSRGGGGSDMYAEDSNGETILDYAAKLEKSDILEWLIKPRSKFGAGMDTSVTDKRNETSCLR